MLFSLCYTSRRAKDIPRVVETWFSRAENPRNVEFILAIDDDYPDGIDVARVLENHPKTEGRVKVVLAGGKVKNCVTGWNAAAEAATGKVLIAVADDFMPPQGWDTKLLSIGPWVDGEHVIQVADGYINNLCTLAIVTRKRYERFGWLFYPGYLSLFSDTELTERAKQDNCLIDARHIVFEHVHPDVKKRERDSVDLKHASRERWNQGEALFNYRKARGFPTDVGPKVLSDRAGVRNTYAVYVQAIKDDFNLLEICRRMIEEGARDFFFCVPDEYWSGKPTPEEDVKAVHAVASKLASEGASVNVRSFEVGPVRTLGLNRSGIETHIRNASVQWIRSSGFEHVLVVDGDELWRRGLLDRLDAVVRAEKPTSVACHMVPVVGLPGYPVGEAKDRVTIYMRADTGFRECRSPYGISRILPEYGVIHFTATRSDMDEIVRKHRDSGHYDDPSYAFEDFIENTLPNVGPGMRNVHMYRHSQIWPRIRKWTSPELADIPEVFYPFISTEVDDSEIKNTRIDPPLTEHGYWMPTPFSHQAPVLFDVKDPRVSTPVTPEPAQVAVTAQHPEPAVTHQGVLKTAHPKTNRFQRLTKT